MGDKIREKTGFYIFHVGNAAAAAETVAVADTGGTFPDRLHNQGLADSPDFQWMSHNAHSLQELSSHSLSGESGCLRNHRCTEIISDLQPKKTTPQNLDANHS